MAQTPSSEIHYLMVGTTGARLCLGCGARHEWDAEHDYKACHQRLIQESTGRFPSYQAFPPDRTFGPEGPREG